MAGTTYVILRSEFDAKLYTEVGAAEAGNGDAAIDAFLEIEKNAAEFGEGDYRAVPARSWASNPTSKRRKNVFV